jgi:membrane protein
MLRECSANPTGISIGGDVVVGAIVTAVLFTIGKSLIGWYIGSSAVASSLWSRGRADRPSVVGLLFSSDIFARGRVH